MTHQYTKLADALEGISSRTGVATWAQESEQIREAARILRAAASVDVAGLMQVVRNYAAARIDVDRSNGALNNLALKESRAALESALRMALAAREGFVLVPREGVEQIADALADVLATFQHAEPEALKAAIQHSNRSAHAAYTLVYGLLAAAPKGTP